MNPVIKINFGRYKCIHWTLVLLVLITEYLNSNEAIFLLSLAYLVGIIFLKKSIKLPQIKGIYFYLGVIMVAAIVGIFSYNIRNVVKDIYYILPSVIMMVLGYYYFYINRNPKKSMELTVIVISLTYSVNCWLQVLNDLSILQNTDLLKSTFNNGIYEVTVGLIVLINSKFFSKKILLSQRRDNVIFIILFLHVTMSISRTALVEFVIGILVLIICYSYTEKKLFKFIKNLSIGIITLFVGMMIINYVAPKETVSVLTDKFSTTFDELNSEQEYNSVNDAMDNWRGYEIQCAKEQWKKSGALVGIFGAGLGKGVYLKYIPYSWTSDMAVNNEIPFLHNGFYTLLPKMGIVGVVACIWLFLSNIIMGYKFMKEEKYKEYGILLICLCVMVILNMYVVRGICADRAFITFGLMLGWINAKINETRSTKYAISSFGNI